MVITIPTVYRQEAISSLQVDYVSSTITDMINKDQSVCDCDIKFLIGNRTYDDSVLESIDNTIEKLYTKLPALIFVKCFYEQLTNFEWALIEDRTVNVRFNMNFMRCMAASNFQEDILYIEDDIQFSNKWFTKLKEYIEILDREYDNKYFLTLYSPWIFNHSKLVDKIPPSHYYGTQAIYVKKEFQKGIYNKILKDGIIDFRHQADLLIDEYCKDNNIPVLALTKSLVQHLGKESTGLGSYHWTENFVE